jgi:hypothetical protein
VAVLAAVNVTLSPIQIEVSLAVAAIGSGAITVTVTGVRALSHPVVGLITET